MLGDAQNGGSQIPRDTGGDRLVLAGYSGPADG